MGLEVVESPQDLLAIAHCSPALLQLAQLALVRRHKRNDVQQLVGTDREDDQMLVFSQPAGRVRW